MKNEELKFDYKGQNRINVGRRIALARIKQGLTQKGLAGVTNKKQTEIALYENGKRLPKDDMIQLIADKLDMDSNWIRYGDSGEYYIERNDYVTEISYSHVTSDLLSKKDESKAKKLFDSLTNQDRALVCKIINALYLDEHKDELMEIIGNEENIFNEQRASNLAKGEQKGKYRVIVKDFSPEEFLYYTNLLYNDLYNKYNSNEINFVELMEECLKRLTNDQPKLMQTFDDYCNQHSMIENRKYLQDYVMVQAVKNK